MRVMRQSPDPLARMHSMTKRQGKSGTIDVKALLREDEEFLRALVRTALQEVFEAEMTEALLIQLAKAVRNVAAIEVDSNLAFFQVDLRHKAEVTVVHILVVIVLDLHDLIAKTESPADPLNADLPI